MTDPDSDELRRLREALEDAEEDRDTLRAHLAAIDSPEAILQDEQHPNGLTPAMRAVRTAIAQREQAERERDAILTDRDRWRDAAETEHIYTRIAEAQTEEAESALAAAMARVEQTEQERNRWYRLLTLLLWQDGEHCISARTQMHAPDEIHIHAQEDPVTLGLVIRASPQEAPSDPPAHPATRETERL